MKQVFLLSPAHCGGRRGTLLLGQKSSFPLAEQIRSPEGAALGDVFSFVSGLYFRGKLAYARAFARPPDGVPGVLVITPTRGLLPAGEILRLADLREFTGVDVDPGEPRFRRPLERDARAISERLGDGCRAVLLGSVATPKYLDVLLPSFSTRLLFPGDFVGRGDMSRGGLLLRCVEEGRELDYIPVEGAARRGPRPPKLEALGRAARGTRGGG